MIKKISTFLALGILTTVTSAFAASVSLTAGNSVTPGNNGTAPLGTLVAVSPVMNFTNPSNANIKGTLQEAVYNNGGNLDYYYMISNTSTINDAFNTVALSNFTGATTSVGYLATGSVAPSSANRTVAGDTVNFVFMSGGVGTLAPGMTSDWMEVDTTGSAFNSSGFVGVIDGTGISLTPSYQPAPATPEPMSMTLLGGGLALLGFARWRKGGKKA